MALSWPLRIKVNNSFDVDSGCIASKLSAELYRLEIIKENIAPGGNETRFVVLGEITRKETGDERTLISFKTNELSTCLSILSNCEITRIDSRPVQGW